MMMEWSGVRNVLEKVGENEKGKRKKERKRTRKKTNTAVRLLLKFLLQKCWFLFFSPPFLLSSSPCPVLSCPVG